MEAYQKSSYFVNVINFWQGWELALSLIRSSLICSKSLILKSDHEQFAHVPPYKRAAVSDSLLILLAKNEGFARKNCIFRMFLTVFPFFIPKRKLLQLLFAHSPYFKERLERFAPVALCLFALFLRATWAIRSGGSDKRSTEAIQSFSRANSSLAHKKQANYSKNRWAKSQPWFLVSSMPQSGLHFVLVDFVVKVRV